MSDLKGTINFLRALRKQCSKYDWCKDCEIMDCCIYFQNAPSRWTDEDIASCITYLELAQKEGE